MTSSSSALHFAQVSNVLQQFATLIEGLQKVNSVKRVLLTVGGQELWVLMSEENRSDMDQVYLLERNARRNTDVFPLEVRVLELTRVSADYLPPSRVLFERRYPE